MAPDLPTPMLELNFDNLTAGQPLAGQLDKLRILPEPAFSLDLSKLKPGLLAAQVTNIPNLPGVPAVFGQTAVVMDAVHGPALSFQNAGDYLQTGKISLGTKFTISLWVNLGYDKEDSNYDWMRATPISTS